MLEIIEGNVLEKTPAYLVIQVGGIGFKVNVSLRTSDNIKVGDRVRVFTKLILKEKELELYGFMTKEEKEIFEKLTLIPGVGPRTALGVLSKATPSHIYSALNQGDVKFFSSVPGIGTKKAHRIIYELQGAAPQVSSSLYNEAISTLMALGLGRKEAQEKLRKVKDIENKTLEEIIKEALG